MGYMTFPGISFRWNTDAVNTSENDSSVNDFRSEDEI